MTGADETPTHLCAVCATPTDFYAEAVVLTRHTVEFRRCPGCGLIAAPDPWWLDEAYSSAIYDGDQGLLRRSRILAGATSVLLRTERLRGGRYLDWAGGYGALARMMRDKGHDFFTYDPYATNLLAPGFDGDEKERYDLVTAFEVVEHLADPVRELAVVADHNDRLFFSTVLHPQDEPPAMDWWYYQLESGQHIALHTRRSLEILGEKLGFGLTSNGESMHLFHRTAPRAATRALLSSTLTRGRSTVKGLVRRGG